MNFQLYEPDTEEFRAFKQEYTLRQVRDYNFIRPPGDDVSMQINEYIMSNFEIRRDVTRAVDCVFQTSNHTTRVLCRDSIYYTFV